MSTRWSAFWLMCLLSVCFVGCNTVWQPAAECSQENECPQGQRCVRLLCRNVASGACQTNDDCASGVCTAQICTAKGGEEPTGPKAEPVVTPDAGPNDAGPVDAGLGDVGGEPVVTPDAGPNDAGPGDIQVPDQPQEERKHRSPHQPHTGCLAGVSRPCRYKLPSDQAQACGRSMQLCAADGTWSACAAGGGMPSQWSTQQEQQGEVCGDNKDNNCNGLLDEGCYQPNTPRQCQGRYTFRHSASADEIALDPVLLPNFQYSPSKKILLQEDELTRVLSLYTVDVSTRTKTLRLRLPALAERITSYDLSEDGTWVVAATNTQVFVWQLRYDGNGEPVIAHRGVFGAKQVARLGVRRGVTIKDGLEIVTHQLERSNQSQGRTILGLWRIERAADGGMEMKLLRSARPESVNYILYVNMWKKRISVHPSGAYVVFMLDSAAMVYALPSMRLLGQIPYMVPPIPVHHDLVFHPSKSMFAFAPYDFGSTGVVVDMSPDEKGQPKVSVHHQFAEAQFGQVMLGYDLMSGELYAGGPSIGLLKWSAGAKGETVTPQQVFGSPRAVALSPSKKWFFVGDSSGDVRVLATNSTGTYAHKWRINHTGKRTYEAAIMYMQVADVSADQQLLIVVQRQQASLWQVTHSAGGQVSVKDLGLSYAPFSVSYGRDVQATFSADRSWLALGVRDNVTVYERQADGSYKSQFTTKGFTNQKTLSLAFHKSMPFLVTLDDGGVLRVWSLRNRSLSTTLNIFQRPYGVLKVGFYQSTDKKNYVLATIDKVTYGFSVQLGAQGSISFKRLSGAVTLGLSDNLRGVRYDGDMMVFWLSTKDGKTHTLVEQPFQITTDPQTGLGSLVASSISRSLGLGVDGTNKAIADVLGNMSGDLMAVTLQELFVWRCR